MSNEQASFDLPLPHHRRRKRKSAAPAVRDAGFAEAMRDARDILQWRVGPNVPEWRVYRLAIAISGQ